MGRYSDAVVEGRTLVTKLHSTPCGEATRRAAFHALMMGAKSADQANKQTYTEELLSLTEQTGLPSKAELRGGHFDLGWMDIYYSLKAKVYLAHNDLAGAVQTAADAIECLKLDKTRKNRSDLFVYLELSREVWGGCAQRGRPDLAKSVLTACIDYLKSVHEWELAYEYEANLGNLLFEFGENERAERLFENLVIESRGLTRPLIHLQILQAGMNSEWKINRPRAAKFAQQMVDEQRGCDPKDPNIALLGKSAADVLRVYNGEPAKK